MQVASGPVSFVKYLSCKSWQWAESGNHHNCHDLWLVGWLIDMRVSTTFCKKQLIELPNPRLSFRETLTSLSRLVLRGRKNG